MAALDALPERERLVVGYRHLAGMTERETADLLGIRVGTVKSRLSRGLARLRTELGTPPPRDPSPDGARPLTGGTP